MPDWKRALIEGFPWGDTDPDDALRRAYAAKEAGLLVRESTEPGSNNREEYGETVFRLTQAGRDALAAS